MVPLTPRTRHHLDALFSPADRAAAARLLEEECADDLPGCEGTSAEELERIRFAALKLSRGNLTKLGEWVASAQADWRDLLVAAGFADDTRAHLRWRP